MKKEIIKDDNTEKKNITISKNNETEVKNKANKKNVEEVNNDNKSKVYLGFYTRYVLYFLFFTLSISIFIYCFINGIKFKVNYNLNYNINPDINYKVNLKPNDYYKDEYLKEDMQYITDLIDNIDINFNYKVNTNHESKYDYKYNIKADIVVTDRNDLNKVLYKDSETLKNDVNVTDFKADSINLLENIKIDYGKYNRLVNSFKSKYTLSASSNLIITMHVDTLVKNGNVDKDIVDSDDLIVTIPLSEQTININKDYNTEGRSGSISKYSYIKIVNIYYAVASIFAFLLMITSIISLFNFIKKFARSNSLYNKKINKIMREYDRIIVTLTKMPNLNEYKIMDVESFEELLDAKQNLDRPILFIEIHKNQKACFLILSGGEAYRYILKEVDLRNEKNNQI